MNILQTCYCRSSLKSTLLPMTLGLTLLLFSGLVLAESKLKDIKVAALPNDQVEITLELTLLQASLYLLPLTILHVSH